MNAPYSSAMWFMPNHHFIPLFLLMAPQFSFWRHSSLFLVQECEALPLASGGLRIHSGPVRELCPHGLRIGSEMGL